MGMISIGNPDYFFLSANGKISLITRQKIIGRKTPTTPTITSIDDKERFDHIAKINKNRKAAIPPYAKMKSEIRPSKNPWTFNS